MEKASCFSFLLGGKIKRSKILRSKVAYAKKVNGNDCPKVKPMEFMDMAGTVVRTAAESARQVRGANEDKASAWTNKIDSSDAGLVAGEDGDISKYPVGAKLDADEPSSSAGRMSRTASPELERSCSNIETARSVPAEELFDRPARSRSYGDLKALPSGKFTTPGAAPSASPTASVRTSCSADRVMLKKRSSRQVLPSRSRKLWWRLLLWSHRNLHRPTGASFALPSAATYGASHQNDGYTSDTMDAAAVAAATTSIREAKNKEVAVEEEPVPSQRVAFSAEAASSLDRVSAWVHSLGSAAFHVVDEEEDVTEHDKSAVHAFCSEIVECSTSAEKQTRARRRAAGEVVHQPSSFSQTLKTASSVAHISGVGLQGVPMIAAFSTLRAVNLSGNVIVHIYPGSLPKGLHSLDLSRNKIASIEGLRELTRLRVLNLSYNRISRIGHGLSRCTSIRELYLAGNKISDVEGLHRLLKLAVLDVSFNRITTARSLGQLVASYGSLRALNLMGNPVQANVGDDTLRKAVSDLLPRLEYLNKQAVKPQRAREVAKDSVAQAALGNSSWGRRTPPRRVTSLSPGSPAKSRGRRSRSKTRGQQGSSNLSRR